MIFLFLLFAACASLLHVFIFYLETLAWTSPLARKTFGMTKDFAEKTKELGANQGVYNLMLAFVTIVGISYFLWGDQRVGNALVLTGCGSMFVAALYLFATSPDKRQAAMKQGIFPLITLLVATFVL